MVSCFFAFGTPEQNAQPEQPAKKDSILTTGNIVFGAASITAAGFGLKLPYQTIAQKLGIRKYYLSAICTQTGAGVAKNIFPIPGEPIPSQEKVITALGYGAYTVVTSLIPAALIATKSPHNIAGFRWFSVSCLLAQAGGVILIDQMDEIKKHIRAHLPTMPPTDEPQTLNTLTLY
jgi:hypothetical protein